jgi:hypothetical protein
VNATGQGWVTRDDNGSVFARSFQAADAIAPAGVSGSGAPTPSTVTINVSCTSFPCTITIVLTAPETVVVHATSVQLSKRKKTKIVTLETGKLTIKSKGSHRLTVHLGHRGKSYVRSHKGQITVKAIISEQIQQHTVTTTVR